MNQPTQLGRYLIVRVLGRGALGEVYEGVDPRLDRSVAIKVIATAGDADPELHASYSARLVREAQAGRHGPRVGRSAPVAAGGTQRTRAVRRLHRPRTGEGGQCGDGPVPASAPCFLRDDAARFAALLDQYFGPAAAPPSLPPAHADKLFDTVAALVAGSHREGLSDLRIETAPGEKPGEIRFTVSGVLKLS
jgi:hypothetical protein